MIIVYCVLKLSSFRLIGASWICSRSMARVSKQLTSAAERRRFASAAAEPASRDRAGQAFERNIRASLAGGLGREIVGGVYPPGSLLPNAADMCARFKVSRTALREAYSVLTAKAMIVARPKIGTRVRPKADWNMLDPEVLSWHLQSTPTEELRRRALRPAPDGRARGGRAGGEGALARHDRPDRRRLPPDGPVQGWRGRSDRGGSRLPHGDSRGDRKSLSHRPRRPHPHFARVHVRTQLGGRVEDPGRSPASASRHSRGHSRRLAGGRQDPHERTAQRLDRRRPAISQAARRAGRTGGRR